MKNDVSRGTSYDIPRSTFSASSKVSRETSSHSARVLFTIDERSEAIVNSTSYDIPRKTF